MADTLDSEEVHLENLKREGIEDTLWIQCLLFDEDSMLDDMGILPIDVAVMVDIYSHSHVAVADTQAGQYDDRDDLSSFLTEMHPDDVPVDHGSGNDLDCLQKIIVAQHEHLRWNRNQFLVWQVVEFPKVICHGVP